jgi:hypothetical protein
MSAIEARFCEELFRIHRRQMRFVAMLEGGTYVFHKDTGVLAFSDGTTFDTQILGLEMPSGQWMWAWADDGNLAPQLKTAAERVKAFGEAHALTELTTGTFDVRGLRCAGHTLAAIASVVHAVHPYFRCEQPGGIALFLLVTSVTLEDDARTLEHDQVRRNIYDMFAAYAQADDMLTLRTAMEAAGFVVESNETDIVGRRGDDEPLLFKREWFS